MISPGSVRLTVIATAALLVACSSSSKPGSPGTGGKGGAGGPGVGGTMASSSGGGGSAGHTNGGATGDTGPGGAAADGGAAAGGAMAAGGATATGGATAAGGGTAAGGAAAGGAGGPPGTTQCSDGIDNDGDGKIDLLDPECVSPFDNDESSFATGIKGDNMDPCRQDCFFDGDSGMGNDGCEWELKCDPSNAGVGAAASCPYDPSYKNCPTTQSQKCIDKCQAITPNGCDCFGCCVVPGVDHAIRLDATCTAAAFGDPTRCPVCTQQSSCVKTCETCQLCLGKTTLDPSCAMSDGGTPAVVCPQGQVVCGTNFQLCSEETTCVSGCCVPWTAIP
jgi:hypothetical protein